MKRNGSFSRSTRLLKIYKVEGPAQVSQASQVQALYQKIEVCEPAQPQFKQTKAAILRLAEIGTAEQALQQDGDEIMISSTNSAVIKYALNDGKLQIIFKQACLLVMTGGELPLLEATMILLKCYTDCAQLLCAMDCASLIYVCSEVLKAQRSDKLQVIVSYIFYNVFRFADQMQIGQDDELLRSVVQNGTFATLMRLCVSKSLEDEALVTAVEALAALCDCECFLDYVGTLLCGDAARLFIEFYDTFVVQLLEDPEERGKMLCFDDVLSWIRRERPEIEDT